MRKLFFLGLIISFFLVNCTEDDLVLNPYDGINYGDTTLVIDTLSATSFVKLHRDVLGPSCNSQITFVIKVKYIYIMVVS